MQDVPRTVAQPFHWISSAVNNVLFEYHEHGTADLAEIALAGGTENQKVINANGIAKISSTVPPQKFKIEYYEFEEV